MPLTSSGLRKIHDMGKNRCQNIPKITVMSTVLAYLAWFQGLAKIEGSNAASVLFLQPLVGTFLAVVLLHEQLTIWTIVGGILILVSVYLISRP